MSVFDGTAYRVRARRGDDFGDENLTEDPAEVGGLVHEYKMSGWDAVEVRLVHYIDTDRDPLDLSYGDYWGGDEEE